MARKELRVQIDTEGRDKGKVFLIREMAAEPLEDWAIRAFIGIQSAGIELPEDVSSIGIAGIARLGLNALSGIKIEDLRPLLREMMDCVFMMPDPSNPGTTLSMTLFPDQIEEISTRLKLRAEWFKLHVGFSTPGDQSTSTPTPGETGQQAASKSTKIFQRR